MLRDQRRRVLLAGAVAAALALTVALAACGGGGSSATEASSGGSGGGEPSSSSDVSSTSGGGGQLSGEPIVVMDIATNSTGPITYPEIFETAGAYEEWVNSHGGIKGRPLKILTCDDKGDPNESAKCAREAVSDEVVAATGFSFNSERIEPILNAAKLPWVPISPASEEELNAENSFPIQAPMTLLIGLGEKSAESCKSPSLVTIDVPSAELSLGLFESGSKAGGGSSAKVVKVPPTAQDYTSQVAQAADGTDCIVTLLGEANLFAFLPALQQGGGTQQIFGLQGNLNAKVAEKFPEATEGAIIADSWPSLEAPGWSEMREALQQSGANSELEYDSLAGLGTWGDLTYITKVVETLPEPSAASFLAAANKITVDLAPIGPKVVQFAKPFTGVPGFARVTTREVAYETIEDGKVKPLTTELEDVTNGWLGKP